MCRIILAMAATYNLGFAVWLDLWPGAVFALFAMTPPWPAQVSQVLATAIGLFALVYGYAVGDCLTERDRRLTLWGVHLSPQNSTMFL